MSTRNTKWLTIKKRDAIILIVKAESSKQKGIQTMNEMTSSKSRTYDMVYIAVFAVLIAICSWISIPTVVPFTLQTFAVFLAGGVLGGKRGTIAVLIYILLGAIGLPVFSNFGAGVSVLFGSTGGYILGFFLTMLIMWVMEKILGKKMWVLAVSMVLGLLVCYAFGTIWFMVIYMGTKGAVSIVTVLSWCVFPFIIPDIVKLLLTLGLSKRLQKIVFH